MWKRAEVIAEALGLGVNNNTADLYDIRILNVPLKKQDPSCHRQILCLQRGEASAVLTGRLQTGVDCIDLS